MLTVVYPDIKVPSGTRSYVTRILNGLASKNYPFKGVKIRKIEFSINGKPVGGIVSQKLFTLFHSFTDHPIHSLSPEVTPKGGDVVTVHDIIPFVESAKFIKNSYDRRAYDLMYQNALNAKILVVSSALGKNELVNNLNINPSNVRVVQHSIDHSRFYFETGNPYPDNGKFHLLTVGDFNPRKRFDILFDIVSKMKDVELYHIGPTNSWSARENQLKKVAYSSKNIFLLGAKDDATLRKYYSNANLFVYISDAEGFGLTPIEAMACGTKVLVNDLPIFQETLGDMGFTSGVDSFGEAIYRVLNRKIEKEELQDYSHRFSTDREINNLIAIYEEVGGGNSGE